VFCDSSKVISCVLQGATMQLLRLMYNIKVYKFLFNVAYISAVVVFLFLAGLWITGANINGPNFHPKLTLAAPTIGYSVSCCIS